MRRSVILFFLALGFVYTLFAAGYLDTADAEPSLYTARALVERGSLKAYPPKVNFSFFYWPAKGGGYFTKMGLTIPALYVAPVWVGSVTAKLMKWDRLAAISFFVSLVNCWVVAALMALLYFYYKEIGWAKSESLAMALFAGLGTYLFVYQKMGHREPVQALCLLAGFVLMRERATLAGRAAFFWTGLAVGLGFLTKLALLVPTIPLLALVALRLWQNPHRIKNSVAFMAPALVCGVVWLTFARLALESFDNTGYSYEVVSYKCPGTRWCTPVFEGLKLQLWSWRSSLLWFNPILILILPWGIFQACRRRSFFDFSILAAVILQTTLYAKWFDPLGGEALGPRYLVVVVPLLFLWIRAWPKFKPWFRVAAYGLFLFSFLVQLINGSVKSQQYWAMRAKVGPEMIPHWAANARFAWHKLRRGDETYELRDFGKSEGTLEMGDAVTQVGFNYWWLHVKKSRVLRCFFGGEHSLPTTDPKGIKSGGAT